MPKAAKPRSRSKITIALDRDLVKAAKILAIQRGVHFQDLVADTLRAFLARTNASR